MDGVAAAFPAGKYDMKGLDSAREFLDSETPFLISQKDFNDLWGSLSSEERPEWFNAVHLEGYWATVEGQGDRYLLIDRELYSK